MLVLSRYLGESIIVHLPNGDSVSITLVSVIGSRAKLGLEATDPEIDFVRDEIDRYEVSHARGEQRGAVPAGVPLDDNRPREVGPIENHPA